MGSPVSPGARSKPSLVRGDHLESHIPSPPVSPGAKAKASTRKDVTSGSQQERVGHAPDTPASPKKIARPAMASSQKGQKARRPDTGMVQPWKPSTSHGPMTSKPGRTLPGELLAPVPGA